MFRFIALLVFVVNYHYASSQEKTLTVGDQLPDYIFDTILNHSSSKVRIADFKGKLVILDSWATWCKSCLMQMPKKEKLQQKFGDRIAIIPITFQPTSMVLKFWHSNSVTKSISLPCIIDTGLTGLLRSYGGPGGQFWIDPQGKIIAITDHEYVNEKEISRVLNGEPIDWPVAQDILWEIGKPLVQFDTTVKTSPEAYSCISFHADKLSSMSNSLHIKNNHKIYTAINLPLLRLYELYFSAINMPACKNRIVFNNVDEGRFFKGSMYTAEWQKKNTYCYEKMTPGHVSDSVFAVQMKEDLDRHFNLITSIQQQNRTCWVIGPAANKIGAVATQAKNRFGKISTTQWTLKELLSFANHHTSFPIIAEKTAGPLLDTKLILPNLNDNAQFDDFNFLKDIMEVNGFQLIKKEISIPMIVFDNRNR